MKYIFLLLVYALGVIQMDAQSIASKYTSSLAPSNSMFKATVEKDNTVIPFQLIGGLMIVDTRINGKHLDCIFDTGAPSIILNKSKDLIEASSSKAVGITGEMKMQVCHLNSFEMGVVRKENFDALEIDISHIEKIRKHNISGIIGVDAYIEKELLFDYKQNKISVLPQKKMNKFESKNKIASTSFYMENQLPVIKVKIGKKNYFFGIDTGAEVNVLNAKCLKKIKKSTINIEGTQRLTGIDEAVFNVRLVNINNLKIKTQIIINQDFVIMDLSRLNKNSEIKIDGILGFPFLKAHLLSLDFKRKKLNFWEEVKVIEPMNRNNLRIKNGVEWTEN